MATLDRTVAGERIKVIKERFEDHLAIAGKTTDMLDDFGFLIGVAEQWLSEAPVQMAVPRTVQQEPPHADRPAGDNGGDVPDRPAPRPKAARAKRGGADTSTKGWD